MPLGREPRCGGVIAPMNDVTRALSAIEQGDPTAAEQLLALVYDELHKLAARKLAHEKPGQTLQATALVNEAYLRLVGGRQTPQWKDKGHFFAAAAEAMRRILVSNARRKRRVKHGGGRTRLPLDDVVAAPAGDDLLALDELLTRLTSEDPDAAEVVKLRYFAGLSVEEAAESLGMSRATAYRHWTFARAWLLQEMEDGIPD